MASESWGTYEITPEIENNILFIKLARFFSTVDDVHSYFRDIYAQASRFKSAEPFDMLIDLSESPLQPALVVEEFKRRVERHRHDGNVALAAGKSLSKLQTRRTADPNARIFNTLDEARAALMEARNGPSKTLWRDSR